MIFDGFPGGPGAEGALPGGGNLDAGWAPFQQPNSFQELFNICKVHHETCRYEGIRKSRMQITKIRKIKAVICSHYNRGSRRKDRAKPSQPGGPSSRGRRILKASWALRLEIPFCFGLVSRSLFAPIVETMFGHLGVLKPYFRMEGIAHTNLS